jgi:hypothetical protein
MLTYTESTGWKFTRKSLLTGCLSIIFTCQSYAIDEVSEGAPLLLWGDTHQHTSNSFDVYLFGTPSSTPETAYRFAKGLPVINPTTGERWQLSRPLDFLVVADHAEALGSIPRLFNGDKNLTETKSGKVMLEIGNEQSSKELQAVYELMVLAGSGMENEHKLSAEQLYVDIHGGDKRQSAWEEYVDVADAHNEPGKFTTLIGWEWSSQPAGGNLHRVVFMPQGAEVAKKFLPFSSLESQDPEKLWQWLEARSNETGADFVAIPHNPNISIDQMFALNRMNGKPVDKEYAKTRMQWEPVVEVTQIKGDSETHPLLSPNDEFADFETYQFVLTPDGRTPDPTEADYARSGLRRGLALAEQLGENPYKFGMIGSTDSHTGIPAVDETAFAGKGQHDSKPALRPHPTGLGSSKGWDMAAAGYVAVWAKDNTRKEIYNAFMRKEVYASTGPRITLRFFGGFDFKKRDLSDRSLLKAGYKKGVPMGGDLILPEGKVKAPRFLVSVMKDPEGANLDRIQIVKGWTTEDGKTLEKVYDVALSDGRTDGSEKVGNTVDLQTGKYTNSIGESQLKAYWVDPDFNPNQQAFYYVRVLEIPTPRYSLLDSIALNQDVQKTNRPATLQERVYSSPIWFTPR